MKRLYLDHNASTPLRPEVRERLAAEQERLYANPSSVHASGRAARAAIDEARQRVAQALGVHEDEVLFTSGGTESDNLALLGALRAAGPSAGLLTSAIEHSAVLESARAAANEGHALELVPVDAHGRIDPALVLARVRRLRPRLVSIQAANNEVGSLGPLQEIGAGLAELGSARPHFHADAAQALGRVELDLRRDGLDLASFSAHKLGGPRGVGVLYKRKGIELRPLLYGGGQEQGLRAGTEDAAAILAAALAIELAVAEREAHARRMHELCLLCWQQVQRVWPGARVHGPAPRDPQRLCNTLNLGLPGADGRVLVARLDLEGLEVSAGSACASGSLEPSHVLLAMGLAPDEARAGVRISFGRGNGARDVDAAVEILGRVFSSLR